MGGGGGQWNLGCKSKEWVGHGGCVNSHSTITDKESVLKSIIVETVCTKMLVSDP